MSKRSKLIVVGVAIIAIIGIFGVFQYKPVKEYWRWNHLSTEAQKTEITTQVQADTKDNAFKHTISYLKSKLQITKNNDTKYELNYQLAVAYYNNGQKDKALTTYLALVKLYSNHYELNIAIADLAREVGNKSVAIEYTRKVIDYLQKNKPPVYQDDVAAYQAALKELEGSR